MTSDSPQHDGLLLVDKPPGLTSHDVVARVRRIAGQRRVGHAGTLDPMATGLLVLGLGRGTRLLGHLTLSSKVYEAGIRFGLATTTDDIEGDEVRRGPVDHITDDAIAAGIRRLTGAIEQVPPGVSAIKVDGRRAYARVRAGEEVILEPRPVTVHSWEILGIDRSGVPSGTLDLAVRVSCSSGTYVRALARDLGTSLGSVGCLSALRRTSSGNYSVDDASTLPELEKCLELTPLGEAARAAFPVWTAGDEEAGKLKHGIPLPAGTGPFIVSAPKTHSVRADGSHQGDVPTAVLASSGELIALVADRGGAAKPIAVFV